jgi:hypothetical protein
MGVREKEPVLEFVVWSRKFAFLFLSMFCFILIQSPRAAGQMDEGSITGTVQDTTGAVLPNAQVTLVNTDQGTTLQTQSDASGGYTFSPVRIGHYKLTASAPGFSSTTQENLIVNVSQVMQVNIRLKPGNATETVQVTTAPPLLQTEEASVGQVVDNETKNNLPLNGRNFIFLAQLGPGAQTPQADTRGNAATGTFSANGLKPAQNRYMLDGVDNNNYLGLNQTAWVSLPPLDAVEEFKVQTADFSPEVGRSAGAVLNAAVKSGTNSLHGDVWEFFRNDVLDAADYFEQSGKGELRQNQFGGTGGGPIVKNKIFFFADYEGLRRVQGNTQSGLSVPTLAERSSGFTNLSDIVTTGAPRADLLGRTIIPGTILDPATTRQVTANTIDPVSGLTATGSGFVRDPFLGAGSPCSAATKSYTTACDLNQIPSGRLDANAVKMLDLYPNPKSSGATANFESSPNLFEHSNRFDTRFDFDFSQKDQVFYRFSWASDPEFLPGPFGGIADGGIFAEGTQADRTDADALVYTHVFSPSMINVARIGFSHIHVTRAGPVAATQGIPAQFGVQGIPQSSDNGGLPTYTISGLSSLGAATYLPGDEMGQALQFTDDFTKILGRHSLKMGVEDLHVKFIVELPSASRGTFDFNGTYTDIPNANSSTTGRAQLLVTPMAASVANGVNYSGGSDAVTASNIFRFYHDKDYYAPYFLDDWKVTPKLTLNLGLRWDYFPPIQELNGGQSNFLPYGGPVSSPIFIIPATGKDPRVLSSTANTPSLNGNGFIDLLAKDGIKLAVTNSYGNGMVQMPKNDFAPRLGLAYQATDRLVVRAGGGIFFNAFENVGVSPDLAENYPFGFSFSYSPLVAAGSPTGLSAVAPISVSTPFAGCSTATNANGAVTGTATLEAGLSCVAFQSDVVNASGLGIEGLQYHYQTPRDTNANLTLQYSLTHSLAAQVAYVLTDAEHEESGHGDNNVTALLPPGANVKTALPFPDFGRGASFRRTEGHSMYNGLQTEIQQQMRNGLSFLFAYTWSKTMSDSGDLLNAGSTAGGYRAPDIPGYGPKYDWTLADYDIRQVLHFSGGYDLPFGKNQRFLSHQGAMSNALLGGWSVNWLANLQGGQPIALTCPTATTTGSTCYVLEVPGANQKLGLHIDSNHKLSWFGNPAAFAQPCEYGSTTLPAGCVAGANTLGGSLAATRGPGFHRLDFSTFKDIQFNDRYSMQFRAEFFNILNHPNLNSPNFSGNGVVAVANSGNFTNSNFGEIGSTRDAPYDPREIQFALKLFY